MSDYRYACVKCGTTYERRPPDDNHMAELERPCEQGDSIPITYTCPNERCKHQVTKHWDVGHQFMAKV